MRVPLHRLLSRRAGRRSVIVAGAQLAYAVAAWGLAGCGGAAGGPGTTEPPPSQTSLQVDNATESQVTVGFRVSPDAVDSPQTSVRLFAVVADAEGVEQTRHLGTIRGQVRSTAARDNELLHLVVESPQGDLEEHYWLMLVPGAIEAHHQRRGESAAPGTDETIERIPMPDGTTAVPRTPEIERLILQEGTGIHP